MTHSHKQSRAAKLIVDDDFTIGTVNRRLFGALAEHLGRCVYGGMYDPSSSYADEEGFRTDVLKLVRELGVTTVRYPGGNFVSGYRWEDGVGPKDQRPRRLDLAWHSTETNQFGLHEMHNWLVKAGKGAGKNGADEPLELMEAVNLGTRGLESALDLLEYANIPSGTKLSDERIRNGAKDPFNIRMWCLGNEMDGPWQLGHLNPEDYAKKVASVARGMRQIDPGVELVACGSSGHGMPTFGLQEQTVLAHAYDLVNFVSCHAYYHPINGDLASFLASGIDMDSFIADVIPAIDASRARLHSKHEVDISFDEWNVWYSDSEPSRTPTGIGNWPVAPHLLEDSYSVADAVVVGDLMITLLKHADRVKAASLAQLVNVIAPIMVPENGEAFRQTTFFPFARTAALAKNGTVLRPRLTSPTTSTPTYGDVPALDAVAVRCEDGTLALFAVNRSLDTPIDWQAVCPGCTTISESQTLTDDDLNAKNTADQPDRVGLKANDSADLSNGTLSITLPPASWTVIHLA